MHIRMPAAGWYHHPAVSILLFYTLCFCSLRELTVRCIFHPNPCHGSGSGVVDRPSHPYANIIYHPIIFVKPKSIFFSVILRAFSWNIRFVNNVKQRIFDVFIHPFSRTAVHRAGSAGRRKHCIHAKNAAYESEFRSVICYDAKFFFRFQILQFAQETFVYTTSCVLSSQMYYILCFQHLFLKSALYIHLISTINLPQKRLDKIVPPVYNVRLSGCCSACNALRCIRSPSAG